MKRLLTTTLLLTTLALSAQMTPQEVVQKQLEAYNDRDIEQFMGVFAQDIVLYDFSTGQPIVEGFDACKQMYAELFAQSPKLHSKILTRTVFDNKVIDHEFITGRKGSSTPIELVLIYEVNHEKITKITVVRKRE